MHVIILSISGRCTIDTFYILLVILRYGLNVSYTTILSIFCTVNRWITSQLPNSARSLKSLFAMIWSIVNRRDNSLLVYYYWLALLSLRETTVDNSVYFENHADISHCCYFHAKVAPISIQYRIQQLNCLFEISRKGYHPV